MLIPHTTYIHIIRSMRVRCALYARRWGRGGWDAGAPRRTRSADTTSADRAPPTRNLLGYLCHLQSRTPLSCALSPASCNNNKSPCPLALLRPRKDLVPALRVIGMHTRCRVNCRIEHGRPPIAEGICYAYMACRNQMGIAYAVLPRHARTRRHRRTPAVLRCRDGRRCELTTDNRRPAFRAIASDITRMPDSGPCLRARLRLTLSADLRGTHAAR